MLKLASLLQWDRDIAVAEPERRTSDLPEVTRLFAPWPDTHDPSALPLEDIAASPLCEGNLLHCRLGYEVQCFSTNCSHRYVLVCRDSDTV